MREQRFSRKWVAEFAPTTKRVEISYFRRRRNRKITFFYCSISGARLAIFFSYRRQTCVCNYEMSSGTKPLLNKLYILVYLRDYQIPARNIFLHTQRSIIVRPLSDCWKHQNMTNVEWRKVAYICHPICHTTILSLRGSGCNTIFMNHMLTNVRKLLSILCHFCFMQVTWNMAAVSISCLTTATPHKTATILLWYNLASRKPKSFAGECFVLYRNVNGIFGFGVSLYVRNQNMDDCETPGDSV